MTCTFCSKAIDGAPFYATQCQVSSCNANMASCSSCAEKYPALVREMAVKIDLPRSHVCVPRARGSA